MRSRKLKKCCKNSSADNRTYDFHMDLRTMRMRIDRILVGKKRPEQTQEQRSPITITPQDKEEKR